MVTQEDSRTCVRWVGVRLENGSAPATDTRISNKILRASSLPMLTKPKDYNEWASKMEQFLRSSRLWHYIQPSGSEPKEAHKETDQMILNWIRSSVNDTTVIDGADSASKAWHMLEARYECGVCHGLALGTEQRSQISSYQRMARSGCRYCQLILDAAKASTPSWFKGSTGSDSLQICDTRLLQLSTAGASDSRRLTGPLPALGSATANCLKFVTLSQIDMVSLDRHTFEFCLPATYDTSNLEARSPPRRSIESLELIVPQRLQKCIYEHKFCQRPNPRFTPRRLLEVGLDGSDPHLVERCADSPPACNEYAALTYCWGNSGSPLITTRANNASYLSKIPLDSFPQTVYDAIMICRRLAIRFLWVDALCIIQDDLHQVDWYEQSGEMLEIFSNAHLVIAADISPNVSSGFLYWPENSIQQWKGVQKSYSRSSEPTSGFVRDYVGNVNLVDAELRELIPRSPLAKRGWALQESILPPRILHFTERGISWECSEDFADSYNMSSLVNRAMRIAKLTRIYPDVAHLSKQQLTERNAKLDDEYGELHIEHLLQYNSSHSLYQAWQRVVMQFSERQLTDPSDKLSALSGLASLVIQALGLQPTSYLAGLWRNNLEKDLLWYVAGPDSPKRAAMYRAPSWSWASMDGQIQYFGEEHQFRYMSAVTISHASCESSVYDPTGRVFCGSITLTGRVQEVALELEHTLELPPKSPDEKLSSWVPTTLKPNEPELSRSEYTGSNGCAGRTHPDQYTWVRVPGQVYRYEVLFDEALRSNHAGGATGGASTYVCLLLGEHYHTLARGSRKWWLVLQAGPAERTFRRVGIGYFHKMHRDFSLFEGAKERTITLI